MSLLYFMLGSLAAIVVVIAVIIYLVIYESKKSTHKATVSDLREADFSSEAYLAGYDDMAKANNSALRMTPQYVKLHALGMPVDSHEIVGMSITALARKILDNEVELDIEGGRSNNVYMGGTDEQFNDYFKGGMAFIEDVEKAKKNLIDLDEEVSRRNRIAEGRRVGLKEIDTHTMYSMHALDELRQNNNPTASFDDQWNKLMKDQKEIE